MLRRILLIVMTIIASYALTGISGYMIYTHSDGRSETQLSLLVRFIFNPIIALLLGALVGVLSKDHPSGTLIVGLAPWAIMLHGSSGGGMLLGLLKWVGPILIYLALGASASIVASRVRNHREVTKAAT
jgi:hypothetical protein